MVPQASGYSVCNLSNKSLPRGGQYGEARSDPPLAPAPNKISRRTFLLKFYQTLQIIRIEEARMPAVCTTYGQGPNDLLTRPNTTGDRAFHNGYSHNVPNVRSLSVAIRAPTISGFHPLDYFFLVTVLKQSHCTENLACDKWRVKLSSSILKSLFSFYFFIFIF